MKLHTCCCCYTGAVLSTRDRCNKMMELLIIFNCDKKKKKVKNRNVSMRRNPIAFLSIFFPSLAIMSLNKKKGVPVSETVTLVGGTDDGDTVCNEGLSLEH